MDFLAQSYSGRSSRRGVLIVAGMLAALTMMLAPPAWATSSGARAWGWNGEGQLGDGAFGLTGEVSGESGVPVSVHGLSGVTAVSASGYDDSLALLSNGSVMAWGANEAGQLGDGTYGSSVDEPVTVQGLSGVTAIAAGTSFGLALLSNGTVMAWGSNLDGELGNGPGSAKTFEESISDVPVQVSGLSGVTAIAAGEH